MSYNEPATFAARLARLERDLENLRRTRPSTPRFRDLADADLWAASDGDVPTYRRETGRWHPEQGGGGGCTHIWGETINIVDWDVAFGQWRADAYMEIDVPAEGRIHVTGIFSPPDSADSAYMVPFPGFPGASSPLGRSNDPSVSVAATYVTGVDAGPQNIGWRIGVVPSSIDEPLVTVSISIIWSECGSGGNVIVIT